MGSVAMTCLDIAIVWLLASIVVALLAGPRLKANRLAQGIRTEDDDE